MSSPDDAKYDMFDSFPEHVEGEMTVGGVPRGSKLELNTLDEPVKETVMRDLRAVGVKFLHVFYLKEKASLLKEWDLWGPLLLCTLMATFLQGSERADNTNDGGPEFAEVFVIVWIGSLIVTLNSKLLGGNISFFQSVCVLGYCLLPCAVALVLCRILLLATQTMLLFFLRLIITVAGFSWATYASMVFLGETQPTGRKALAMYPIFLFYFIISWLVVSHTNV